MFKTLYHPRVLKFLKRVSRKEREKILDKLEILQKNPFSVKLNVKKLTTTKKSYRLRLSNFRIIYEIDDINNILYLHDIDFRGNIY